MVGCIPRSPSPAIDISDHEADETVTKSESSPSMMDSSNDQSNTSMKTSAGSPSELLRQIQILNVCYIFFSSVFSLHPH